MTLNDWASVASIVSCAVSIIALLMTFKINKTVDTIRISNDKSKVNENRLSGLNLGSKVKQTINDGVNHDEK